MGEDRRSVKEQDNVSIDAIRVYPVQKSFRSLPEDREGRRKAILCRGRKAIVPIRPNALKSIEHNVSEER